MKDDFMLSRKNVIMTASIFALAFTVACEPDAASSQTTSASISGAYCEKDALTKTVAISQQEGSPDIFVGVDYWSPDGQNCGLNGEAKAAGENKWILQETNASDGKICELTITNLGDRIEVRQGGENCSDFCGARMSFDTQSVALSSKTVESVTREQITGMLETPLCPQ